MHFCQWNCCILFQISLKYVRKGPIGNNPAAIQIMAWHRPGDKPLSEQIMVRFPTYICVNRPQWVKIVLPISKERKSFKMSFEISRNIEALEMLQRVMIKYKRFSDSMHIILIWWLLMPCRLFGVGHLITVTSSHDERDGVWNHRRLECLFNHLFRCRTNKT